VPASVSRRVALAFLLSAFLAVLAGALGISFAVRSSDASRSGLETLLPAAATANELFDSLRQSPSGLSSRIGIEQRALTTHARALQDDTLWLIVAILGTRRRSGGANGFAAFRH
jgi:hypothetical protein